jgi:hypothetical protein
MSREDVGQSLYSSFSYALRPTRVMEYDEWDHIF